MQNLVSTAIAGAQQQFVSLIENKDAYVSTTGGNVTLEYGSVVADLATRLGVDPATISKLQGLVQELHPTDLRQRLTTAQARISSVRSTLSQLQAGKLTPTLKQNLQALHQDRDRAPGEDRRASRRRSRALRGKVPDQLKGRLSALQGRLSKADSRVTALKQRTAAVLANPSTANVTALDASLASAQSRINTVLNRQAVQTPGQLVLMSSGQLSGLQKLVSLLRNLGFVLPVLALLLYLGALYLAKGWRREALIAAGGGILVAAVFILLLRRLIGNGVDSVAASDTVKPAITSVWDILSAGLRQRALFVLAIGLGVHRRWRPGGPGPPRGRGATLPRPLPARPSSRGVRRRGRALPALAVVHTRHQQPRAGPGDRRARGAGRGRHRDPAAADGAGVSSRCERFLTVFRVSDGTRTRDHLDHNQELYQLSYAHRAPPNVPVAAPTDGPTAAAWERVSFTPKEGIKYRLSGADEWV